MHSLKWSSFGLSFWPNIMYSRCRFDNIRNKSEKYLHLHVMHINLLEMCMIFEGERFTQFLCMKWWEMETKLHAKCTRRPTWEDEVIVFYSFSFRTELDFGRLGFWLLNHFLLAVLVYLTSFIITHSTKKLPWDWWIQRSIEERKKWFQSTVVEHKFDSSHAIRRNLKRSKWSKWL